MDVMDQIIEDIRAHAAATLAAADAEDKHFTWASLEAASYAASTLARQLIEAYATRDADAPLVARNTDLVIRMSLRRLASELGFRLVPVGDAAALRLADAAIAEAEG